MTGLGNMIVIISDCFPTEPDIAGGIETLNGRPLAEYSVRTAKAVVGNDRIFLSSQHEAVLESVSLHGITGVHVEKRYWHEMVFLSLDITYMMKEFRPIKDADDDCFIVLLSTLTPFLEKKTLESAIQVACDKEQNALIGVSPVRDHPLLSLKEEAGILNRYFQLQREYTRRQDFPPVYEPNTALQIFKKGEWKNYDDLVLESKAIGFVTEGLDALTIESRLDLLLAKKIFKIKRTRCLRTNAEFMKFLQSNDAFTFQDART